MIKIENIDVYGWDAAIRGARNPMNSWDRMDSGYNNGKFEIGENDYKLLKNLTIAGPEHRKWNRMVTVTMDITAPMVWWSQYDTYKISTVANSTSKMHKIHAKPFTRDDFSCDTVYRVPQERVPIIVDNEIWKETDIEGVLVSNTGKVKQLERDVIRSDGRKMHLPERLIAVTEDDYLRVKIRKNGHIYSKKLHRLMAEAFIPNPDNLPYINHKDGNKLNCNLDNLEWCTASYNRQHAVDNGLVVWSNESRDKCGKRSRKLSDEEVEKVKTLKNEGKRVNEIARIIGCSNSIISRICSGKSYIDTAGVMDNIIETLNQLREAYLETGDKKYWRQMIELLPETYNQKRTVHLNYETLGAMYHQRRHHKIDEWHVFCDTLETLPYSEFITREFE